jgi:hypothetical protein
MLAAAMCRACQHQLDVAAVVAPALPSCEVEVISSLDDNDHPSGLSLAEPPGDLQALDLVVELLDRQPQLIGPEPAASPMEAADPDIAGCGEG